MVDSSIDNRQDDLLQVELTTLIAQCSAQTQAFFRRRAVDPRFCYELFRRALEEQTQAAWDALYREYAPLVAGWVREHPGFAALHEEAGGFVNCAFAGLWRNLAAPGRLVRFPTLDGILAYLKACARSCVRDELRRGANRVRVAALEDTGEEDGERDPRLADARDPGPQAALLEEERQQQLLACVQQQLRDDRERLIYLASFEWDLKPREIFDLQPGWFQDVQEVYRLKRNLLDRLSRDPQVAALANLR